MMLTRAGNFFTVEQEDEAAQAVEVPPTEEAAAPIQFTYHSGSQMIEILKKTEGQCPEISRTYSIGRSTEGRELLVIEFSNSPGEHQLREFSSGLRSSSFHHINA